MSNSNQGPVVLRSRHPLLPPHLYTILLTAIPRCLCLSDPYFNFGVYINSYTERYVGGKD